MDIFPTAVELLELPRPEALVGRSHARRLRGGDDAGRDALDIIRTQQKPEVWALSATLPTGRFKLVRRPGKVRCFHCLTSDPDAHRNVMGQHPDEARRMDEFAMEVGVICGEAGDSADEISPPALSDEIRDQLRAIGNADEVGDE